MALDPKRLNNPRTPDPNEYSFERPHNGYEDTGDSSSVLTLDETDYRKRHFASDQQLYNLPTHISSHSDVLHDSPQTQPSTPVEHPFQDSPDHPLRAFTTAAFVLNHNLGTDESLDDTATVNQRLRDITTISDKEGSDLDTDEEITILNKRRHNAWAEKGAAIHVNQTKDEETGEVSESIIKRTVSDFKFGKQLGIGSYSTVLLATDNKTGKQYAVKVLDKRHIIREKKVKYVNIEKNTLHRLGNRNGIVNLFFTFQDETSLYFVLDYASNGELLSLIKEHGSLNEDITRYYSAQILDAIKYMHDNGVVHRDLKPENILLDERKRVQITDFGTAKLLEKDPETGKYPPDTKARSFVGTAEYVSPELLNEKAIGKSCDIWALGCIIYQMIAGKPPFKATNEYLTFQKIIKLQYAFTAGFPMVVRDLIKRILRLNPNDRLTIKEIQQHHFFSDIDFSDPEETVWGVDPPEAGPYKITAKSMLPVPELAGQKSRVTINRRAFSSPQTPTVNSVTTPKSEVEPDSPPAQSSSVQTTASQQVLLKAKAAVAARKKKEQLQKSTPETKRSVSTGNAANAATVALSRQTNDILKAQSKEKETQALAQPLQQTTISSSSNSTAGSSRPVSSGSLYIKTRKKPSQPKPSLSSPMTALDIEFKDYLNKVDERVIKKGELNVSLTTVESIEKKFKGKLVDSPLGATISKSSLLSQVANGSYSGLRNMSQYGTENEKSVITNHSSDTDVSQISNSERAKSKIKKLFTVSSSEDEKRSRLLIATNYGRVLLFSQDPETDKLELRTEIHLHHPVIRIKELLPSATSDNVGLFAIESYNTAFLFEAEQGKTSAWTRALNMARESANEKELEEKLENDPSGDAGTILGSEAAKCAANIVSITSSPKSDTTAKVKSPVLLTSSQVVSPKPPTSLPKASPTTSITKSSSKNKSSSFISSALGSFNADQSKETKGRSSMLKDLVRNRGSNTHHRKAKEIPESGQLYHGLPLKYKPDSSYKPKPSKEPPKRPSTSQKNPLIAAAEAALSNDKSSSTSSSSLTLSSSSTSQPPKLISGMNSRLLARSTRKSKK